jgi:tetratricopeptide (TPR) repeat protein
MFTGRTDGFRIWFSVIAIACLLPLDRPAPTASAQEAAVDEELAKQQKIVDRFLTVLEKNPRRGMALDRVYGFHVESGTLDALIQRFQERTTKTPQDGMAWMILGLMESQRGRDAAVEAFSKAAAASTNDPLPAYYLGQSQVLVGQPDQAVKAFELALTRKPAQADLLEIFQALGRVHQRAQRTDEALKVWARLENLFPNDARVQEQIAAALAEENQSALALPRYEKLIQLTKDDYRKAVYRIEAAELKVKLNRSQEAIGDLEKLLATLNPSSWLHREVRRKIDDVFLRTDDQDGLAKYYLASVTKNPEDVDGMARLARILSRQGRVPEAQVWLDKALKLAPTRKELRQTFIEQLVEDQRYTEAIAQYELLDKAEPNNPDILREWGKLILRETSKPKEDRLKLAETVWRRLLISKPKDPLIATQVADLFRHSEMSAAALELYLQAVSLAPNEPQYLEYLGEYYHHLKRDDEALATWKKITEGKNRTATNLARLAEVLSSFGYLEQAIPEIQAACTLEPKDLTLYLKAADLLTKAEQYPDAVHELTRAESLVLNAEEAELVFSVQLKVYQLEGSLERRANELEMATQGGTPTARKLFLSARCQEALHRHPEAMRAIEAALKLQPQSIPTLAAAARIHEKAGHLISAVELNHRLAAVDRRGRSEYLKYIAQLETQLGRPDAALKAGRDLIASAPANTEYYEFYASLCFRLGKTDEGLQTLRRAVQLNPNDSKLILVLAESLSNQNRTEEAIELYWQSHDKSTTLDEKLHVIQKLTELYSQTNHFEKLLERIERIRRDAEDKRESTICLAQAYDSAGDYGMSRKELESLLTENTRDTQLLRQLAKLSTTEGDLASAVKYQQQLAKVAPGPETEYPLAMMLAQMGATQVSTAITVQLASKEQDPEKFLRSVDSLLISGNIDSVLQITEARLRDEPKNWELIYREGVALVKQQPDAAKRRFQSILELPFDDAVPGIELKNRLAKEAKAAGVQNGAGHAASYLPTQIEASTELLLLRSMSTIRDAVGLSTGAEYDTSGRQTSQSWAPSEFGHARMAAIGWLYRLERDNQQGEAFLEKYKTPAESETATSATMLKWLMVSALASEDEISYHEDKGVKAMVRRLAVSGDLTGQMLFMGGLFSQQTFVASEDGTGETKLAPLPPEDLALLLSCYAGYRTQTKLAVISRTSEIYLALVMQYLTAAGRDVEAKKLYQSVIEKAATHEELILALQMAIGRDDLSAALDLFKKWSIQLRQTQAKTANSQQNQSAASAMAQLIGVHGAANKNADCLVILDHYLDFHQEWTNQARQNPAGRNSGSLLRRPIDLSVWNGSGQTSVHVTFPAPGVYYDMGSLSVLRTAYEAFKRNEAFSDLQRYFAKRLEQSADGNKVYAHLALAYLHWWQEDRDAAVQKMTAASHLVGNDWKMKLEIARFHIELQNLEDALAIVDSIAPLDQDSMRERETLALDLAARLGDTGRAKQAAERLFGLRLDASTQFHLAELMRRLGMEAQAEAVMSRVQRQGGNRLQTMVTLMDANQSQGKSDAAIQIAYQILRRSRAPLVAQAGTARVSRGGDASARTAALRVLEAKGKLKEMIATAEEQLKRSPNAGQLVAVLAEYYEAIGDKKMSLELEAKQVEANTLNNNLRLDYAMKLVAAKRESEACDHYLILLKNSPRSIGNQFFNISQVFRRAKRDADLVKVLSEIDLKRVSQHYYVSILIGNLMRTREQQPLGLTLMKKAWDAFPDQRTEMLVNAFRANGIWRLPEVYRFSRQSLIPTVKCIKHSPWSGLDQVIAYTNQNANNIFSSVISYAAEQDELLQVREEIAQHAKANPSWKAGPLMLAVIDVHSGNLDRALPILTKAADVTSLIEFPIEARWIIGQELLAKPELRQLAIKLYESTIDQRQGGKRPAYSSYRQFTQGPAQALVKLYAGGGNVADAKRVLTRSEKLPSPETGNPYQNEMLRVRDLTSIAQEYEALGFPVDALRIYQRLATGPILTDPSFLQYYGTQEVDENLVNLKRLIHQIGSSKDVTLSDALLTPNPDLDEPGFDLMLDLRTEKEKAPYLDNQLVKLLNAHKVPPEAVAPILTRLHASGQERPIDISIPAVAAIFAVLNGSSEQKSTTLMELTEFVRRSPLEALAGGQRPNSRQRKQALEHLALWPVAVECLKHDQFRSTGEVLAARVVEAARRHRDTKYSVAVLFHQVEVALLAGDRNTAEQRLTTLLELVLPRPRVRKAMAQTPVSPKPAAPTVVAPETASPTVVTSAGLSPAAKRGVSPADLASQSQAAIVPTSTYSQFRLAMLVADNATEHNLHDLAFAAIAGSLAGGLPIEDIAVDSAYGLYRPSVSTSGRVVAIRSAAEEGREINNIVAAHLPQVTSVWMKKGHPPEPLYRTLHDIVVPKIRPTRIDPRAGPVVLDGHTNDLGIALHISPSHDLKHPQSLGRDLVHLAAVTNTIDALRTEIVEKQSQPASAPDANVMLVLIALETKDPAAAIPPLRELVTLLKNHNPSMKVPAAVHAAGLAMSTPELAAEALPILETAFTLQPKEGSILGCERLVVDHYLKMRQYSELRTLLDAKLAASQAEDGSVDVDYVSHRRRVELITIVGLVRPSNDLPLILDYLGRYIDVTASRSNRGYEPNLSHAVWSLTRQMRTRPAEEQYSTLKLWTLPVEKRRSLRYLSAYLPGPQVPASFLSAEQQVVFSGEQPAPGLVSSFSLLVDAARKAGKLDELQVEVDQAVAEKLPLADGLATLIAVARNVASVAERLNRLIEESQSRVKSPPAVEAQTAHYRAARWLDLQILHAAVASGSYHDEVLELGKAILQENRNAQGIERLLLIVRIIAVAECQRLSPAEQQAVLLPTLRLWHSSDPLQMMPNDRPPAWWTAIDGKVSRISGPALNQLRFKYPLTGTFEFSMESNSNSFSDLELGYGSFVPDLAFRFNSVLSSSSDWTRHSVQVSPDLIRFYSNGKLTNTVPSSAGPTPWLYLAAYDSHRFVLRNFKITGEPTIPREVNLLSGDRLDGWKSVQGDRISIPLLHGGPRRKAATSQEVDQPQSRPFAWEFKDGVLNGESLLAAKQMTPAHLLYFRPIQNGDTLKYEFFYQPDKTLIQPALGSLALLLKPDGVRLHWLDSTLPDSSLFEVDNEIDEKQNRRGPDTLPLKPAEWNEMQISLDADTVRLTLNGQLIFERPIEASNTRHFGLFYDRQLTDAKVRNVVLTGKWPEKLTPEELANVLIPENADESLALKQARKVMIRDAETGK